MSRLTPAGAAISVSAHPNWQSLAIRGEDYLWFQLAEHTYDTYMMIQQRKGLV